MSRKLKNAAFNTTELKVDEAYQRLIVPRQVRLIADNYNEVAFGRILVGQRTDGSKWVVDGQQRHRAALTLLMDTVPCVVFESKGRADEAEMFVMYNAHRTGMRGLDIFRAAVVAGDKDSVALLSLVEQHGFTIKNSTTPECIKCVGRLFHYWRRSNGRDVVGRALTLLKEAWFGDTDAIHSTSIGGVCAFVTAYFDDYDPERLVKTMKKVRAADLMNYARGQSKIMANGANSSAGWFRDGLVVAYNKGMRRNKLQFINMPEPEEDAAVEMKTKVETE